MTPEGLPDAERMRELMNSVSRLVEDYDTRVRKLTETYGVHWQGIAAGAGTFLVARPARSNETWGIYFSPDNDPHSFKPLKACRIEVKLAFLERADDFIQGYESQIRETCRRIEKVLDGIKK